MSRLYVIGNGFDLFHGLATDYKGFLDFLGKRNTELADYLESYFSDNLWSSFEEGLGTFDAGALLRDQLGQLPDEENDSSGEMHAMFDAVFWITNTVAVKLPEELNHWVSEIPIRQKSGKVFPLDKFAQFFTFNYTRTLQELYGVEDDRILHIHGQAKFRVRKPDEVGIQSSETPLVIGHSRGRPAILSSQPKLSGMQSLAFEEALEQAMTLHSDLFKSTEKIITENDWFFSSIKSVDQIIVVGHSLSDVDGKYFERISESVSKNCEWLISCYGKSEFDLMRLKSRKLIRNQSNIRILDICDPDRLKLFA